MFVIATLVLLAAVIYFRVASRPNPPLPATFSPEDRILLVTAHPDDECMFFSPTLLGLAAARIPTLVLCLSSGNHDGLGPIRRDELKASCAHLGIPPARCTALDDPTLQDHPTRLWDPRDVSRAVAAYMKENAITKLITFDSYGVSGHTNHIATSYGLRHLLAHPAEYGIAPCPLYTLTSVSILRKYISALDTLFTIPLRLLIRDSPVARDPATLHFIAPPHQWVQGREAMKEHASQMVWFRWIYIAISRYMVVNDLVKQEM